jgi:hypothetical protein
MVSDLIILVLPMPLLYRLRMDRTKRILLMVVFSVGLLVPIASAVRFWGLYLWANSGKLARYYGGYMIFWYVASNIVLDIINLSGTGPKSSLTLRSFARPHPLYSLCSNAYYTNFLLFSDREARTTTMEEGGIRHPRRLTHRPLNLGLLDVTHSMAWRVRLRPTSRRSICILNLLKWQFARQTRKKFEHEFARFRAHHLRYIRSLHRRCARSMPSRRDESLQIVLGLTWTSECP